jgi:hypothetical protein
LQIHVLFPHDGILISDSDITQLLQNLPKGLWDALDRALDRVPDARYGKRIFQLIMAAQRPLTVDELRVALHVKPGNTNWDTSSLPQDKRAIVPLCGGGLLETDEEDDTVRFIHHSIYQYFVDGAKGVEAEDLTRKGTHNRYFFEGEAELYFGLICVTYLSYSIFERALTVQSKVALNSGQLSDELARVTTSESRSGASRIIAVLKSKRPAARRDIDIGQLLQRYIPPKADATELLKLSDYAHQHWICHTSRFHPDLHSAAYMLFKDLVNHPPEHVVASLPWKDEPNMFPRVAWATENHHFGVLSTVHHAHPNGTVADYVEVGVNQSLKDALISSSPVDMNIFELDLPSLLQEVARRAMQGRDTPAHSAIIKHRLERLADTSWYKTIDNSDVDSEI